MRKILTYGLLTTIFLCAVTAQATIMNPLRIKAYHQKQSNWCWAGVSQTIRKYNRDSYRYQCKMASTLVAKSSSKTYCCINGKEPKFGQFSSDTQKDRCNEGINTANALKWNGVHKETFFNFAHDSYIAKALRKKKPVAISIGWNSGGGHAMIIYGRAESSYTGDVMYMIWNPGQNRGSETLTRKSLIKYRNAGKWRETIFTK